MTMTRTDQLIAKQDATAPELAANIAIAYGESAKGGHTAPHGSMDIYPIGYIHGVADVFAYVLQELHEQYMRAEDATSANEIERIRRIIAQSSPVSKF